MYSRFLFSMFYKSRKLLIFGLVSISSKAINVIYFKNGRDKSLKDSFWIIEENAAKAFRRTTSLFEFKF